MAEVNAAAFDNPSSFRRVLQMETIGVSKIYQGAL
jgi:hypothetical protein